MIIDTSPAPGSTLDNLSSKLILPYNRFSWSSDDIGSGFDNQKSGISSATAHYDTESPRVRRRYLLEMADSEVHFTGGAGGEVGFSNSGQVDWIAFGNTMYSASLAVMQRLSNAGIQPITHGAGLALGCQLRLSTVGTRRMEEALQKARAKRLLDGLLEIGFGVRSIIHVFTDSQPGLSIVAVCACLASTHSIPFSARILGDLWDEQNFPSRFKPSAAQLRQLVKICSGILLNTSFPETVNLMYGPKHLGFSSEWHAAQEGDIAKVLRGLFQVSMGQLERIQLHGYQGCALIAAMAFWLFNLHVLVQDEDEQIVFTSTPAGSSPQVHVQYGPIRNTANDSTVRIKSKSYHLQSVNDVIKKERNLSLMLLRVAWGDALEISLRHTFQKAMNNAKSLGTIFGAIARINTAFATGELRQRNPTPRGIYFPPSVCGENFKASVKRTFPELLRSEKLSASMERSGNATVKQARLDLESSLLQLIRSCGCGLHYGHSDCTIAFALTVTSLVFNLSFIVNDSAVKPTLRGLSAFYRRMESFWQSCSYGTHRRIKLGPTHAEWVSQLYRWEELMCESYVFTGKDFTVASRLDIASIVFAGQMITLPLHKDKDRAQDLARCDDGVCAYSHALEGLSCDPDTIGLIHVVPGFIQRDERAYDRIVDCDLTYPVVKVPLEVELISADQPYPSTTSEHVPVGIQGILTESLNDQLVFSYTISIDNTSSVNIQVSRYVERVLNSMNFRPGGCLSSHSLNLPMECSLVKRGFYIDMNDCVPSVSEMLDLTDNLGNTVHCDIHNFMDIIPTAEPLDHCPLTLTNNLICCLWNLGRNNNARILAVACLMTRSSSAMAITALPGSSCITCCLQQLKQDRKSFRPWLMSDWSKRDGGPLVVHVIT